MEVFPSGIRDLEREVVGWDGQGQRCAKVCESGVCTWPWSEREALKFCPLPQLAFLERASRLGDTEDYVGGTPVFHVTVAPLLGDTVDYGLSRMMSKCWILAHVPKNSAVRVLLQLT